TEHAQRVADAVQPVLQWQQPVLLGNAAGGKPVDAVPDRRQILHEDAGNALPDGSSWPCQIPDADPELLLDQQLLEPVMRLNGCDTLTARFGAGDVVEQVPGEYTRRLVGQRCRSARNDAAQLSIALPQQ